jgi:hypothetical protein
VTVRLYTKKLQTTLKYVKVLVARERYEMPDQFFMYGLITKYTLSGRYERRYTSAVMTTVTIPCHLTLARVCLETLLDTIRCFTNKMEEDIVRIVGRNQQRV